MRPLNKTPPCVQTQVGSHRGDYEGSQKAEGACGVCLRVCRYTRVLVHLCLSSDGHTGMVPASGKGKDLCGSSEGH